MIYNDLLSPEEIEVKLKEFEELCKVHDWFYDYSDDHSVWKKGEAMQKEINTKYSELLKLNKGAEARRISKKHSSNS